MYAMINPNPSWNIIGCIGQKPHSDIIFPVLQKQVRGVGEKVGDGARVIVAGKESDEVATDSASI